MSELKHIKDVSQDLGENFAALRDDVAKLTISVTDLVRSQASTTTGTVMEAVKGAGQKLSDSTTEAQNRLPGYQIGVALMSEGGTGYMSPFAVIVGSFVDLSIGIGIAIRRSTRFALYAALAISLFYAIAGTIILPRLWIDPLGPMVKIFPIMVLNLVVLAILKDR